MECIIRPGNYEKMGAVQDKEGIIFTFAGEKTEECAVLLYKKGKCEVAKRIAVPPEHGIGSLRSVRVTGIDSDRYDYNYEIDGKVQVDPYARRIVGREHWFDRKRAADAYAIRCGFEFTTFDWMQDQAPEIPKEDMVMYKMHVRGYTMDATGMGKIKGSFLGIKEKIPYLKQLGITTIELMPVYEFEELVLPKEDKLPDYITWKSQEKQEEAVVDRVNYWGYVPGNYFAPKEAYAAVRPASLELKDLIRELHSQNMECILEIFFDSHVNHNYIIDVLRYWVMEYHVDGFHVIGRSLPLTAIAQDLLLSRCKIFNDGLYPGQIEQRGDYQHLFAYNEEFLYPMRKLLNHMGGNLSEFTDQMRKQHAEMGFVNYVASNNGFTLADVFSYNEKHNEANGENNADGNDWNYSNNCGVEGTTRKEYVRSLRTKQIKNALALVVLAQGVPLLMAGDEFANSQKGNNNAYCQDNKVGWVNWKKPEQMAELTEYTQKLIRFRREHKILCNAAPLRMTDYKSIGYPDLSYHCDKAWVAGFEPNRQSVGMMYCEAYHNEDAETFLYVAYNFHNGEQMLALPKLPKKVTWMRIMDTSCPQSFLPEAQLLQEQNQVKVEGQSISILIGRQEGV